MKLVDRLTRKIAKEENLSEEEVHRIVIDQFEFISRATKTDELKIEISGMGYLQVNQKRLTKEVEKMEGMKKNLENYLKDQPDPTREVKLESLLQDLQIIYAKVNKSLEK